MTKPAYKITRDETVSCTECGAAVSLISRREDFDAYPAFYLCDNGHMKELGVLRNWEITPQDREIVARHFKGFGVLREKMLDRYAPAQFSVCACPVCHGACTVSRPPHIPGDVPYWSDSSSSTTNGYPCKACDGKGFLVLDNQPEAE